MSKYTELITNYHAGKPLFYQHVDLSTRPLIDVAGTVSGAVAAFDIDTAIGAQLDVLGEWIGRSRTVATPIDGIYLSFDTERVGWDQGLWQGPFDPDDGFIDLSDDVYRVVLKTKIGINNWDGKNDTLPDIINSALEGTGVRIAIVDNQDMTVSVWITSDPEYYMSVIDRQIFDMAVNKGPFIQIPDDYMPSRYDINPIDKASAELVWVIRNGYLIVKAAGVHIREIVTPSVGYQFFGFDIENEYVSGFDSGSWEGNF